METSEHLLLTCYLTSYDPHKIPCHLGTHAKLWDTLATQNHSLFVQTSDALDFTSPLRNVLNLLTSLAKAITAAVCAVAAERYCVLAARQAAVCSQWTGRWPSPGLEVKITVSLLDSGGLRTLRIASFNFASAGVASGSTWAQGQAAQRAGCAR